MRALIVSDIHANIDALEAVLNAAPAKLASRIAPIPNRFTLVLMVLGFLRKPDWRFYFCAGAGAGVEAVGTVRFTPAFPFLST